MLVASHRCIISSPHRPRRCHILALASCRAFSPGLSHGIVFNSRSRTDRPLCIALWLVFWMFESRFLLRERIKRGKERGTQIERKKKKKRKKQRAYCQPCFLQSFRPGQSHVHSPLPMFSAGPSFVYSSRVSFLAVRYISVA